MKLQSTFIILSLCFFFHSSFAENMARNTDGQFKEVQFFFSFMV